MRKLVLAILLTAPLATAQNPSIAVGWLGGGGCLTGNLPQPAPPSGHDNVGNTPITTFPSSTNGHHSLIATWGGGCPSSFFTGLMLWGFEDPNAQLLPCDCTLHSSFDIITTLTATQFQGKRSTLNLVPNNLPYGTQLYAQAVWLSIPNPCDVSTANCGLLGSPLFALSQGWEITYL